MQPQERRQSTNLTRFVFVLREMDWKKGGGRKKIVNHHWKLAWNILWFDQESSDWMLNQRLYVVDDNSKRRRNTFLRTTGFKNIEGWLDYEMCLTTSLEWALECGLLVERNGKVFDEPLILMGLKIGFKEVNIPLVVFHFSIPSNACNWMWLRTKSRIESKVPF